MKKIFGLLTSLLLLNGCAESVALLGTSVGGASSGKIVQSSLNSAISYGIKQQTGKSPLEHAIAYAEEKNPEKKEEPCSSFIERTIGEDNKPTAQVKITNDITLGFISFISSLKTFMSETLRFLALILVVDIFKLYMRKKI